MENEILKDHPQCKSITTSRESDNTVGYDIEVSRDISKEQLDELIDMIKAQIYNKLNING